MFPLPIKIVVLAALVRLLVATDKPFLCASIFGGAGFLLGILFGEFASVAMYAGGEFVIACLYFWILNRMDSGSAAWWVVAVTGVPAVCWFDFFWS